MIHQVYNAGSFGIYRYVLATAVVYAHLSGLDSFPGAYAVFCFFALSGYLMTLVLNRTYGFSRGGVTSFLTNRFLRLFPSYFVVFLCTLVLCALGIQYKNIRLPSSLADWVYNAPFLPQLAPAACNVDTALLVPQAWSLAVELFFYVAMALVLARSRRLVVLWFAASLVYPAYMMVSADIIDNLYNFFARYCNVIAGSLPFSLGAMLFYYKDILSKIPRWHIAPASALFLLSFVAADVFIVDPNLGWLHQPLLKQIYQLVWSPLLGGFYVSLLLGTYVLACLSNVGKGDTPSWLIRTDRFFGDLSYPIFLCHFIVGLVVAWATGMSWSPALFFLAFVFTNFVAWAIHTLVEERIASARRKVRDRVLRKPRSDTLLPEHKQAMSQRNFAP